MNGNNEEKEWIRRITQRTNRSRSTMQTDYPETSSTTKPQEETRQQQSVEGRKAISLPRPIKKDKPTFDDVAGMDQLKKFVTEGFINVLRNSECAKRFGIYPPSMLLYGPAGCGKTFFAEVLANEVGVNFIKVVPDDIASKWVHGTQEKIGEIFKRAERESPTILFFDEFDAMVPKRTENDRGSQNGEVNEFLCMLNNASEKGIYVIAATNHPDCIDRAVLRSGRIDEMVYVDMPDKAARESLFRIELAKRPADREIDYALLAELTAGYNCSDIAYIVKVASRKVFNMCIADKEHAHDVITQRELEHAIAEKVPSVSSHDLCEYERVHSMFASKAQAPRMAIGFMK